MKIWLYFSLKKDTYPQLPPHTHTSDTNVQKTNKKMLSNICHLENANKIGVQFYFSNKFAFLFYPIQVTSLFWWCLIHLEWDFCLQEIHSSTSRTANSNHWTNLYYTLLILVSHILNQWWQTFWKPSTQLQPKTHLFIAKCK